MPPARRPPLAEKRKQLAAKGKRLGSPDPSKGAKLGAQAQREQADRFAANILPVIREVQKAGVTSLRGIAAALNARGVKTARGGIWGPQAVANVLQRGS